jgi:hypothetical protein
MWVRVDRCDDEKRQASRAGLLQGCAQGHDVVKTGDLRTVDFSTSWQKLTQRFS